MSCTAREVIRRSAPVAIRCEICKLDADPGDGAAFRIDVMYGGREHGDEGNDLIALWRHPWICEPCIKAIVVCWNKAECLVQEGE